MTKPPGSFNDKLLGKAQPKGESLPWVSLLQATAHLPRAESLEEEEEREAPDHGGADDAEQGDELDPLATPELGKVCSRQPRPLPTFSFLPGPLPDLQAQS